MLTSLPQKTNHAERKENNNSENYFFIKLFMRKHIVVVVFTLSLIFLQRSCSNIRRLASLECKKAPPNVKIILLAASGLSLSRLGSPWTVIRNDIKEPMNLWLFKQEKKTVSEVKLLRLIKFQVFFPQKLAHNLPSLTWVLVRGWRVFQHSKDQTQLFYDLITSHTNLSKLSFVLDFSRHVFAEVSTNSNTHNSKCHNVLSAFLYFCILFFFRIYLVIISQDALFLNFKNRAPKNFQDILTCVNDMFRSQFHKLLLQVTIFNCTKVYQMPWNSSLIFDGFFLARTKLTLWSFFHVF